MFFCFSIRLFLRRCWSSFINLLFGLDNIKQSISFKPLLSYSELNRLINPPNNDTSVFVWTHICNMLYKCTYCCGFFHTVFLGLTWSITFILSVRNHDRYAFRKRFLWFARLEHHKPRFMWPEKLFVSSPQVSNLYSWQTGKPAPPVGCNLGAPNSFQYFKTFLFSVSTVTCE